MVEPAPPAYILRGETPKPGAQHSSGNTTDNLPEPNGDSGGALDSALKSTGRSGLDGESLIDGPFQSLSMSERSRTGQSRRGSASQSRRQTGPSQPSVQTSGLHYAGSPENVHNAPSATFQSSPVHYSVPYNQRQTFGGQYMIPPQQPLNMAPTPPPYTYSPGFQHPGVADSSMMAPNLHTNYPHILQSPYQYQDGPNFSNPSLYSGAPSPPPMSPMSPQIPSGQNASQSPTYTASGQFPMRYQSSAPFAFAPQSFPTSPVYQSQYAHNPYSPPFASGSESEGQGVWFYLPPGAPTTPSYQNPYPMNYPANVHEQSPYFPPSTSSPSPGQYPKSPVKSPTFLPPSSPIPDTGPGTSRTSNSNPGPQNEKPSVRRSYHPNPPAHRSEWVMWTGNVPSDASHDELWRFFNQNSPNDPEPPGVISIFLISRTNCSFINYDSENSLKRAIARFNGQPLRPHDPRCPRLLCRVRKKDDDLKAGVGGQRGMGMHIKWIKEQKGKDPDRKPDGTPSEMSDVDDPGTPSSYSNTNTTTSFSPSDDEGKIPLKQRTASSSGSYASTSSSILTRYFPQRYFILKSLTQYDLDLSVEKGVWATQKHNEGILDQAFRTSKDVYLIFGVNKSGEFYGYARMVGPIRQGDQRVPWAHRDGTSSTRSSLSPVTGRKSETIPEEGPDTKELPPFFAFDEHRLVEESPLPMSSLDPAGRSPVLLPAVKHLREDTASAPAELTQQHQKLSLSPLEKYSLDQQLNRRSASFKLEESAVIRNARTFSTGDLTTENAPMSTKPALRSVVEEEEKDVLSEQPEKPVGVQEPQPREENWGETFRIEWISTKRVPFYRTRHIRNPWNHDREVKVSRDGTELEPSVGKALIEEWDELAADGAIPSTPAAGDDAKTTSAGQKRGGPSSRS